MAEIQRRIRRARRVVYGRIEPAHSYNQIDLALAGVE